MFSSFVTSATRPDKKKLSLFFPGISSSDVQNNGPDGVAAEAGPISPGALASPSPAPVDMKKARRKQTIRDGLIILICLVLSVAFLVFGPAGDFIAGRAFTITTTNQVTYIYYNWTVQLPLSTPSLDLQAYNNRLVGNILFTTAPSTDFHFTISIETTVPSDQFTFTPWAMYSTQESGFTVDVSDLVPNTYNIDYANIIFYIPAQNSYSSLTWNTSPITPTSATLPIRKWNVAFDNLTAAAIQFDSISITTDSGAISSMGIRAGEGYFQTSGGPITGEYTIPPTHLTFNTSGGGSFGDK